MTYSLNGKIQSSDYNGFADSNSPNVNLVWATGSSNSGYGQTALSTVLTYGKVQASNWANLFTTISTIAQHQASTITTLTPSPTPGGKVSTFIPSLSNNISTIYSNRLNAAVQSGTSTTTATNSSSTWSNSLTITFTVTFTSANTARYYFNAGGQIGFNFSHPAGVGTTINVRINDLCSDAGTVWLSSPTSGTVTLATISYSGVTKSGGANPAGATISTNSGFYALTSTSTQLFQQTSDIGVYTAYSSTFLRISASNNGSGVLTFTCLIDEVPNGATVSTGTQANLILRPPSTTYLSNSWGTPTVGSGIVAV